MASNCATCGEKKYTAQYLDCKIHQKEKNKAFAKLANMASRYPTRLKLEQNKVHISTPVILDSNSYQIVTYKRKKLKKTCKSNF